MFLENFVKEKQWQHFIEYYRNRKTAPGDTLIADEDIWPFIISAFLREFNVSILVITSTLERACELENEINCIIPQAKVLGFTSLGSSVFYKNKITSQENLAGRLKTLGNLINGRVSGSPFIIIAPSNSLMNLMPSSRVRRLKSMEVISGNEYDRKKLIEGLIGSGYERVSQVYDRGEFSIRGGVIDIFGITDGNPVRIDFFGDEAEKIFFYNVLNKKPIKKMRKISIFPNINPWEIKQKDIKSEPDKMISFIDLLKQYLNRFSVILCDKLEIYLKIKSDIDILKRAFDRDKNMLITASPEIISSYLIAEDFLEKEDFYLRLNIASTGQKSDDRSEFNLDSITGQKKSYGNSAVFIGNIKKDMESGKKVVVSIEKSRRREKVEELLLNNSISYSYIKAGPEVKYDLPKSGVIGILDSRLYRGYKSRDFSLYGELDIYEHMLFEAFEERISVGKDFQYFEPGEYIVHKNHGIGKYIGIVSKQTSGNKREYFLIAYANNDKLYVPTWQADRISKYIGAKDPVVTTLDSRQWDNLKKRVRKSVKRLAVDLAKLYAERESTGGHAFPPDSPWQKEIEDLFPFKETPDQVKAINYVKSAMQKPRPMDLLLIGDVGFGKTEVAVRAAFKAIENGKQVMMLVPTTILADQHYRTFSQRYREYPVFLEVLSRFRTKKKQKNIVDDFNSGRTDMLIGTHRILQKDIEPRDLGLIIVDEEQRFGVNSKEKIKLLKTKADVLTLSATPIPRTLYMSLAGVRDIVLIETYPEGRNPIETFIGKTDYIVIKRAIEREISRGGQVYYVHNRITGINIIEDQLQKLVPEARIALTHGRMDGSRIEKTMSDFIDKKYDILLTTSIIESGMDIANVNTLIVENSHLFGLSQLYQLRGRVGRSSERAYSYFFYPNKGNIGFTSFQRLKALAEYTDLGSGYNVALRDLEIRGAGEILGPRQHGHINSVGFDMYCQIISEEIEKLKGNIVEEDINIQIELPISAYIPKNYIESERDRANIYKVLGNAESIEKIDKIRERMILKYGKTPLVAVSLINIAKIKYLLKKMKIGKLSFSEEKGIILRKVDLCRSKAAEISKKNKNLVYEPVSKQIVIKKVQRDVNLVLVLSSLNDIISLM